MALQFRAPGKEDATADAECKAVSEAAARRSADLTDLEKFLAGVRNPVFTGDMKKSYKEWYDETEALRLAAVEVEKWFDDREPVIDGQAAADAELKRFAQRLEPYTQKNSIFTDRGLVAGWRVRASARMIAALANTVRGPYKRVLDLPLPLPSEAKSADVKTAIGALREMKAQLDRLERVDAQAKADGVTLPKDSETAKAAALATAREWAASDELLGLFADPDLFADQNKATAWLPRVQEQFARTQTEAGKELIRKKVQQFCEAYVPKAARLDAEVLIQGKKEPRAGVTIEYDSDAKSQVLTDLPDKLNEFNFKTRHKNFDRIAWSNGSKFTGAADALRPTPKSLVARDFSEARAGVTAWSLAAVNQLKMKCEGLGAALQMEERRNLTDDLVGVGDGPAWTKENTKIWTRLTALSAAMGSTRSCLRAGSGEPSVWQTSSPGDFART